MKKAISYSLIIIYLFSFPEMRQVLKLPNLVEHYISHKIKSSDTTIFSFIKMHYFGTPVKDADYKDDLKLPFKSHDHCCVAISIQSPPKTFEFNFENHFYVEKIHNFQYSEGYTIQTFSSVFRPPILG